MSTPDHPPRRPEGLRCLAPLPPPGALAFLLWMASLFLGIPGLYAAITAPTVETGTAFSGAYSTHETVYAVVNPNGAATSVAFEYGLSANYGSAVLASPLPAGFQVAPVTAVLGGLTPGAQYHYRVVATNSAGVGVGSDRTFTARNETIEVLAHYRMGEMDGANYSMAASGSEAVSLVDSVGNHSIPVVNPSTFGGDIITAQPVYSTHVAPASSSDAGSSRSLDFANGNAYALSGVFFPWADNFCLEAWVKAGSLSGLQYIAYNGSALNGWGLCLDHGVYKASSHTTHFANYIGEDFGYAPASLTEWTHLALVSDNGKVTFYANGLPAGSPRHPLSLDGGVFTVGKGPNFIFRFGGQIDELRLSQFPGGQFNVTNLLFKSIPPKVSRSTVTSLESQSAVVGGTVEEQGGSRVTECGIVYSRLSQNELPTVAGTSVTKVKVSEVSGTFATTIAGLEPATAYVFRPYAVSSAGITYGPVGLFATDFVPLVHYRLGELDPGAAVGGVASSTINSLGGTPLALFGTPTYSSDTAAGQESLLSLDWSSGVAYGKSSSWPVFTDNFGFEAWVKPTTTSGTRFILYNGPADRSGWGIFQNGATFQVLYGGQVVFGSAPVTVNQWTHLAVVRDGGVSTFYVNGMASGTTLVAPLAPDGGPGFALGADPLLPSESRWIGSLDEVRLFAFRPGQFRMGNLLLFRPEIDLEQPAGIGVADGDLRGFGGVPVGTGSSLSFKLRNVGNRNLAGVALSIDGVDAAQFSVTAGPAASVDAGGDSPFEVRFAPSGYGFRTAVLHISSDDPDENPFEVTLTGMGIAPEIAVEQPLGRSLADGDAQDFGVVDTSSVKTLTFTVRNLGNADLFLNGTPMVTVKGGHASDFSVVAQPSPSVLGAVETGLTNAGFESPALGVAASAFSPGGTGWTIGNAAGVARNGSPWFSATAPEGTQAAFLQRNLPGSFVARTQNFPEPGNYTIRFSLVRRGLGYEANDVEVRMDDVSLGRVSNTLQSDDVWRTFTVDYDCTVPGNHNLSFVGVRSGGDYTSALDDIQILHEATFQVRFAPTVGGPQTATLSIDNNDPDEAPFDLVLRGTGVALPELTVFTGDSLAPMDERADGVGTFNFFGTVVGERSAAHEFTIRNTGVGDLTGLSVSVSGANPSDFVVEPTGATTLGPNETTTFSVTFGPGAAGTRRAVVAIASNDADENPFEVNVSGTGILPLPKLVVEQPAGTNLLNGANRDFGAVEVGGSRELDFTLRNMGAGDLVLNGAARIVIAGANSADFAVTMEPESPVPVVNLVGADFESPGLGLTAWAHRPSGTGWIYEGQAGVSKNGAGWFVNGAPSGGQAAFLQNALPGEGGGTKISQETFFDRTGEYLIRFSLVRRGNGTEGTDLVVRMDGVELGAVLNVRQPDDVWRTFSVPYTCTTPGRHILTFEGTRTGGDYASAIDDVRILGATTFRVRFTPRTWGFRSAMLSIASNDASENPFKVFVTGMALAAEIAVEQPVGTPRLGGAIQDLGAVSVGGETNLSFTLRNLGNTDLVLNGAPRVAVGGPHASDFTITEQPGSPVLGGVASAGLANPDFELPGLGSTGWLYSPGGSAWKFGSKAGVAHNGSPWYANPAPSGAQAAFVQSILAGGDAASTFSQEVSLAEPGEYQVRFSVVRRGFGYSGTDLAVRMDGVTLGTVPSSSQPDDVWRTFVVPYVCTESGRHTLSFVGTRGGGDFSSAVDDVQILGSTEFQVRFAPAAGGLRTATLSIESNDPDEGPYELTLTGTGVFFPEISAFTGVGTALGNELADNVGTNRFEAVLVGRMGESQSFTLRNSGNSDLTDLSVVVEGVHSGDFVVGPLGATTLAPNATTTFTVTFVPTAGGARRAVVSIASNDGDENPFKIQLSGEGTVAPEIAVFTGSGTALGDEWTNPIGTNVYSGTL
ncbi:MAG: choice-of-anchor D domain-containing protein, partial [Verrucomicrobiales bacterium]|nr:choice-of-anchor D domain-containing protein [Verrucomicrobiales bacterium]